MEKEHAASRKNWVIAVASLALLAICGSSKAGVWEDLGTLRQKYSQVRSFAATHTYTLTDAEHPEKVISVQQGSISYSPDGYRYVLGKVEFVGNAAYNWAVYRDVAEMVVQVKDVAVDAGKGELWDFKKMDAMLQAGHQLQVVAASEASNRAFRIGFMDNPAMPYRFIEVEYNPAAMLVERIQIAYSHDATQYGLMEDYLPLLTVVYTDQRFDPVLEAASYSEAAYFKVSQGEYVPGSKSYQHYQILTADE